MGKHLRTRLVVTLCLFFTATFVSAADRYWVGGTGAWHETSHWSGQSGGQGGASVPAQGDDVYFDAASFTQPGQTVSLDGKARCRSFTWTGNGAYRGVLGGSGEITIHGGLNISGAFNTGFTGSWIMSGGQTTLALRQALSGNFIIRDADLRLSENLYVNGDIILEKGSLDADGKIIACRSLRVSGNASKALLLNSAELYFTGTGLRLEGPRAALTLETKRATINGRPWENAPGFTDPQLRVNDPLSPQNHTVVTIVVPSLCNGDCLATATAVVSGGSGNFSYQWSNGDQTQTADSLCAGTYLVVVTDNVNFDQVPAFAVVNDPPPLVIFFNNTPASCNGVCDGSSAASVAGGTAPYTYLWAPGGQTTPSITNQCAGVYTLTITDANNCTTTQMTTIFQPNPLVDNGTLTNVTCFGNCDGTASVSPAGGTAPYTVNWQPGNQPTPGIINLCPGSYTATITDANGCTDTYIAIITQPQPLSVTATPTNASCNGVCDGAVSTSVSGGTPPYSYSWSPGGQTTPSISNVCAGTYTVDVTDANGCTFQRTVTVTEPAPLNATPTGTNITCFNACNGTASANASGGSLPYSYSWAPGGQTTAVATNLCPGTYTVTVTDANGCQTTGQVTITEPTLLLANASGTNIACFGVCNGSATANPAGGIPPYTYSWAPGGQTTQTINNLCPGTFTVTVQDANGCTSTGTVTITEPLQLQTNVSSTNVSCNAACDGTASSAPSGGTAPYSFNWAPGGQTTSSINGLCAGSYTLTVTDANGCTRSQTIIITQPNVLDVNLNATQIPCNSSCNATLGAVVVGGTAPYTYSWSPGGETTQVITNQCAGSYTVQVTDNNGCTDTATVTITQPTALTLTPNTTSPSCNAFCNGSATVAVGGGTPPYSYSWSPGGQTTSVINNICAGTYTVTVTDANGCNGTATIIITEPQGMQANLNVINATCNGVCNGVAIANPTGGTGPYTYSWSPGGQTTSSVNGLCAGNYTVQVTDANGCNISETFTITQPPPLLAVITGTTSSCGICNGTATVAVNGGVAPYAFFWSPSGGTNPTATGLCVDDYTVTVTDAQGCTTTATTTITYVVNIVITSSQTSLSCFGACDGVASANAAGGTAPYTYSWAPSSQTTQNVSGLCAGSYTVTVTDAVGCFNSETITFNDPPLLSPTLSSTNASCFAACDGSASVNTTGGTGAYQFLWQPGGQTTSSVNGLCAGTYTVTVTDAMGCDSVQVFTITEPTQIQANATTTPANCTLCDGSATAAPSGGTGPYTFIWAPGGQTTPTITNLCPGIYTVTVTDFTGCAITTLIAVSNLNGPTVQASSTNATCNGVCDGTATANVTGGIGPFTFDWNGTIPNPPGDGTNAVTGLCADSWFVQVTDAVGCITFTNVIITEPPALTASASITHASCNAVCDGSITVTPSGGTGPYTYAWLPGGQTTQTVSGLCAGTYTVDVTDANGCLTTFQYTITEPQPLSVTMSSTDVTCNAACNGTAQATVTGGSAPFTYMWAPSGQITPSVANMCPGTYTVSITDANGCTTQQQVVITEPTALLSSVTSTDVLCNGDCNGTATVSASGGTPGYTYLWSPGGGTTATATNMCAGAYSVVTMDANGCASVVSVTINQPPSITTSTSVTDVSCFGVCDGTATVNAAGGTGTFIYTWAPGGQSTPTATALCAGTYTVTVTDANGCTLTDQATVTQPAQLQANTSFNSPSCFGATDGTATASPVGGTGPYSYLWAPGGQTTPSINGLAAGSYTVTVQDANGCQDIQVVNVVPAQQITVSLAGSPANCGSCNGTINVTPAGGTAPYTYSWSGGLPAQPNQTNLCANLYTVTITDANGCSSTFTVPVNNSNGPSGETVVTTPETCPSACDGTATVTPIGGTVPYVFDWQPGTPVGEGTNAASGLCAGNYFLQVTDSNGCIRFSPVVIAGPAPILANQFVTNATCTGICDGAISVSPTGGTAPYSYNWAPGGQTTASISNLCTGTYTVTITDANGCTQIDSATVAPWNTINVSITTAGTNCGTFCNGSATANVVGGNGPFTYQWTDPLGQVTPTATGLCPGTYTVNISDAVGCSTTQTTTLTASPAIQVSPVVTNTACGQCNGSVTLSPSGGTPPYSFLWSDGSTAQNPSGLCAGVYTVVVSDAAGCSAQLNVSISSSNAPSANLNSTNISCFGQCTGIASVAPSGGVAPYSVLWLPGGQTSNAVNNLCAGAYNVLVMDSAGCTVTQSFTVTQPAQVQANQVISNADCGVCNGSITAAPTGGTAPYTFSWAPGGQTTPTISNLCAGMYTLTLTDAAGCTQAIVIPVSSINSGMTLTTNSTNVSCNAACDGTASVNPAGGIGPYTFSWSNGATTSSISALCPGTYIVQVTDANGCVASAQVIITEPPPLSLSFLNIIPESCPGTCNGMITAIPSGGTLSYTYTWSDGQNTQTADSLCAGSYTVTVTDANGCSVQQNGSFVSPQVLVFGAPNVVNSSCNTLNDGSIDITVSGGTLPYTYSWTGPGIFTANTEDLSSIFSGTYTVVITDAGGCQISDTLTVQAAVTVIAAAGNDTTFCDLSPLTLDGSGSTNATSFQWLQLPGLTPVGATATVIVNPPSGTTTYLLIATNGSCSDTDSVVVTASPLPAVDAGPGATILTGGSTVIGGSPTGPPGSTFTWGPVNGLGDPSTPNPVAAPTQTTTYTVTVTTPAGCSASDTVTVTVLPEIDFPNGFTPNGDGVNDVWVIDNIILFPNCVVEVYNRWGELLFRSVGYDTPWDGRYDGQLLPVGTYYYVIDLNDPLFTEDYTGPITIMR